MKRLPKRIRPKRGLERLNGHYPHIPLNRPHDSGWRRRLPSNQISTTKYSIITFIPKNLFEQFRRMTNVYFLIIVIITLIPQISPLTPWTSILPLAFVLGVNALKEGYEDLQRFKADTTINYKKFSVIEPNGKEKKKRSQDIKAGEMIKVKNNQFLPADILAVHSPLEGGLIYIETAQLDGETNLKKYYVPKELKEMSMDEVLNLKGTIETEVPTKKLDVWKATLHLDNQDASLEATNLLLRGSRVKNTDYVYGVVVYTGKWTKLSRNQNPPPSKFSTIDRRLNKSVIAIFIFKLCCVIVATIGSIVFNSTVSQDSWYLDMQNGAALQAVKDFFAYFALLSFMIPMSLMVTLEIVKVLQGKYMEWDENLAQDPRDVENTGMKTKTTNLNDELALVKYVFSDKTGTLTENCMRFRQVSINGTVYENAGDGEILEEIGGENEHFIREFLVNLAVCQAATVDTNEAGELEYHSPSPDEEALLDGARTNGYTVHPSQQPDIVVVEVDGNKVEYQKLAELEFTSERARMTTVVRCPDGKVRVYSKGADTKMLPLLGDHVGDDIRQKTIDDLEQFSTLGLRTLLLGYKEMDEQEYEEWAALWNKASTSMGDRKHEMSEAAKELEKGFTLLGSTAIEDRLQQDVPETIHNLLRANIKVWMITGDKQTTAENIAKTCRLTRPNQTLVRLTENESMDPKKVVTKDLVKELLEQAVQKHCSGEPSGLLGVVIDGKTLEHALHPDLLPMFLQITSRCHSVVACRVSPIQKAEIVKNMKEYTQEVCLAIGDGANDVAMIQEAHIGIGIFGKEGTQAARSSDYAIREFRHLRRLLTVHGRYSCLRNSNLIQYSIYKNASAFLVQFWYAFYCGYSATTIYDDWIISFFNIFFTSVPPLFYAIFEKDITEDIIDEYPEAFRFVQSGRLFCYSTLFIWMLLAIWNSLVFFFGGAILLHNEPYFYNGKTTGLKNLGNMVSSIAIITVILKVATISNLWNVLVFLSIVGSIGCYVLVFAAESAMYPFFPEQFNQFYQVVSNPCFWAIFIFCIMICLVPDLFMTWVKREFYPDDWMILQEAKKYRKFDSLRSALSDRGVNPATPEDDVPAENHRQKEV